MKNMKNITYDQAKNRLSQEDKDYLDSLHCSERGSYYEEEGGGTAYVYLPPLRWHRKYLADLEIKTSRGKKYIPLDSFVKISREEKVEKNRLEDLEDLLDRWSIESSLREEPTLAMAKSFVGKPTCLQSFSFWIDQKTKVVVTCNGQVTRIQVGSMDTNSQ